MPIFCAGVSFDGQHDAPSPPSLPTAHRKVRKIEFLLEPVKCIIADDAGASQLAEPCAAASQRPLAQRLHPKNNLQTTESARRRR
jgi:hypothetical protein